MAELNTIARPYARAVFQHALEGDRLEAWEGMLNLLAAVVQDATVQATLDDPARTAQQCADTLVHLGGEELDSPARNLVVQLATNKRLAALPEIARLFHEFVAARQRFRDVELLSAYDLEDSEAEKIGAALQKRLALDVNVSSEVDESLIGGVVVRAGDTVIDGSVRGRLDRLAERLNSSI